MPTQSAPTARALTTRWSVRVTPDPVEACAVAEVLSPLWWTQRLYKRLQAQARAARFFDAYYTGNHPLPWLAPQARTEFRRVLEMTRANVMGLVCDAQVERCTVEGFRLGPADQAADRDTWRMWQASDMDSHLDQGLLESAITGTSFLMVAPNPADEGLPHVWVEHCTQAALEYVPGSGRRQVAAALKVWTDEWSGQLHATLYLPDVLVKWQAPQPAQGSTSAPDWEPRAVAGESWPARNPLGVVPMHEVPNNPRLLSGGVSELADVTDIQDRINKTLADRLITQDYGAFPQKWAVAWPDEDAQGNPTPPIQVGRDRMLTTSVAETKFGQFDAAPLDPYSGAKREDVKDVASRTRTPAQYLLGELSNVNGETLRASESGLVSKVRSRHRGYDTGLEPTIRLMRRAAGLPDAGANGVEVLWRDPQYRTEGELTDAVMKRYQSGIITLRQARLDCGYSQSQVDRMEADEAREAARVNVLASALAAADPDTMTGTGRGDTSAGA